MYICSHKYVILRASKLHFSVVVAAVCCCFLHFNTDRSFFCTQLVSKCKTALSGMPQILQFRMSCLLRDAYIHTHMCLLNSVHASICM